MAKPKQAEQPQQEAVVPATEPVPAEEAAGTEGGNGAVMIDLSGVPDETERPVIPRGIYPATVDDVTFGYSQASGNPMWTWVFELSEAAGDYAGRKLFFHTPFVEVMMPRVKKVIGRVASELLNGPFDAEKVAQSGVLVGKACRIRLDIKQYEGKPRNNVRDVLPPEEGSGGAFLQTPA
jgi:hypothetical protein